MRLWIDDIREAPRDYIWIKDTNSALRFIRLHSDEIELIDLDHDAGDYAKLGGDYIAILRELQRLARNPRIQMDFSHIKFRLHSANPVGVLNMRAIIEDNGWKEIK